MHNLISDRRLAANRANAQKSTGPRTSEGKRRSSLNAVTHGITALAPVLNTEDRAEFDRFTGLLYAWFAPRNPVEEDLFVEINTVRWLQKRLRETESCLWELETQIGPTPPNCTITGPIRTAFAFQTLAERSNVLPLLNRRMSCLSREHSRLMKLYLELHGPLEPPPPPDPDPNPEPELEPEPPTEPEPEKHAGQNEANAPAHSRPAELPSAHLYVAYPLNPPPAAARRAPLPGQTE